MRFCVSRLKASAVRTTSIRRCGTKLSNANSIFGFRLHRTDFIFMFPRMTNIGPGTSSQQPPCIRPSPNSIISMAKKTISAPDFHTLQALNPRSRRAEAEIAELRKTILLSRDVSYCVEPEVVLAWKLWQERTPISHHTIASMFYQRRSQSDGRETSFNPKCFKESVCHWNWI